MRPEDLLARLEAGYAYDPMYGQLCTERDQLKAENAKLRELVGLWSVINKHMSLCATTDCGQCPVREECEESVYLEGLLGIDPKWLSWRVQERMAETTDFQAENAKLRDALKALMMGTNAELCAYRDEPDCKECSMHHGNDGCAMVNAMEMLGIDMFGEPLGVKS